MTIRTYLGSAELAGDATVVQTGGDERGAYLVLDQTLFHPQGGGQKADQGTLAGKTVLHVGAAGAEIRHYLDSCEGIAGGDRVALAIDGAVRAWHARLHTGGHLLAALAEDLAKECVAVSGHHWPGEARVELEFLTRADLDAYAAELQARTDAVIASGLPVQVRDIAGRTVAIGAHRAVPCGGTHCANVAMIGALRITGIKSKKGRTRISYDVPA